MNLKETLDKIEKNLGEIEGCLKAKKKAVAYLDCVEVAKEAPAVTSYDIQYLHERLDWIRQDMNDIRMSFYQHMDGHLPKLDVAALTKAIKLLGLDDTYEVAKRVIYASDGTIDTSLIEIKEAKK